jgi:hypothetical protein
MRLIARFVVLVVLSAAVTAGLVGVAPTATACSCRGAEFEQYVERNDAIFLGQVTDAGRYDNSTIYTVDVLEVWKGELELEVEVTSSGSEASCGVTLSQDRPIVVWGQTTPGGLTSGLCSQPFEGGQRAKLTRLLGEPVPPDSVVASPLPGTPIPEPDPAESTPSSATGSVQLRLIPAAWVLVPTTLVLGAAGGLLLLRRRRSSSASS